MCCAKQRRPTNGRPDGLTAAIVTTARVMAAALKSGGTVLAFGNGGSAADAQHFVAELVGRYEALVEGELAGDAATTS